MSWILFYSIAATLIYVCLNQNSNLTVCLNFHPSKCFIVLRAYFQNCLKLIQCITKKAARLNLKNSFQCHECAILKKYDWA